MGADWLDRIVDRLNAWIIGRSGAVILTFLLVTTLFAGGLGDIQVEEGTQNFVEGAPAQEALDSVEQEFSPPFEGESVNTQLIQRGENVLTQRAMVRLLRLQLYLERTPEYQVVETESLAQGVAQVLDPTATTTADQLSTIEQATDAEVREATRTVVEQQPDVTAGLSNDFSPTGPYASATIATVTHEDGVDPQTIQQKVNAAAVDSEGDIMAFGQGILQGEFSQVIQDSLLLIMPVVLVLLLIFLVAAYRDPFDLLLGMVALFMAIIWTFGFTGLAGIAFTDMMVAIPPLLLAIGIDFGIHAVNRYREERTAGAPIDEGMAIANRQLLVAFFIVTGTTVIGFGANMLSSLPPVRNFGFVASVGILFTFLIFGVFVPATKVWADRIRERHGLPMFTMSPLGSEDSILGRVLTAIVPIARGRSRQLLLVTLVLTAASAGVATTVDTTFDDRDFLPPEDMPAYVELAPGPLAPGEYTATETITYLEDTFESGEDDQVTMYTEGPIRADFALESIERADERLPDTFVSDGSGAAKTSILDVIETQAEADPGYARLVDANDMDDDGVPDRNVEEVLQELLASEARPQALEYITADLRSMRVVYSVEADALQAEITADAAEHADEYRLDATPTGQIVVFQEVTTMIFESAILALLMAVGLTAVFLMAIYHVLEGRASLGVANLVPILVTVAGLGATMAVLDIPLNAMTGTVLSITIGVGVAYSVHVTHRFIDEYNACADGVESLMTTLGGTGGALTGSMLTTLGGAGSLVLAITPVLGQFGFLMSLSVIYSFVMAIVVLAPTLLVWEATMA